MERSIESEFSVTETDGNCRYIAYIAAALAKGGAAAQIGFESGRVRLSVAGEEPALRRLAEEKVADILCIGYKYAELRPLICPAGLGEEDREILVAAVIAADLAEDLRCVLTRLRRAADAECTIDGFYRFRLSDLRAKWRGVAACVPAVFTRGKLADFMEYLLGAGRGKVFLKGDAVFDARCRRLRRSSLIEGGHSEMNTLREIVLSGAGKVECLVSPSSRQEDFLRRYYGGRVCFAP